MSTKKASIILCGTGRIGNVHLNNILANRRIEIVAVVDVIIKVAQEMADVIGCKGYPSLTEALAAVECDGVVVTTPTATHVPLVKEALSAGKHVFCEKPIGLSHLEVYECYDLAKEKGKHLLTGFQRRFDPTFMALKDSIDEGKIGTLHKVKTFSRDNPPPSKAYLAISGGLIHDCAVHDIDLLRWITGMSPVSVYTCGSAFDPNVVEVNDIDVVEIIFKFANGVLGSVDCARLAVYGYDQRIECLGDKGILQAQNEKMNQLHTGTIDGFHTAPNKYSFPTRYKEAYSIEMDHFADLILGVCDTPKLSVTDVAHVTVMLDAAYESHKTGKIVEIKYPERTD